jgi:hypothetical protein
MQTHSFATDEASCVTLHSDDSSTVHSEAGHEASALTLKSSHYDDHRQTLHSKYSASRFVCGKPPSFTPLISESVTCVVATGLVVCGVMSGDGLWSPFPIVWGAASAIASTLSDNRLPYIFRTSSRHVTVRVLASNSSGMFATASIVCSLFLH